MDVIWGLNLNEIITISISLLAIIISLYDRWINKKENKEINKKAEDAIKLAQGITEMELRNSISTARSKINEFGFEFKKFKSDKPQEDYSSLEKIFRSILEDFFNHYDRGCRLYLEGKIDRKSFKKEYKKEIQNIVENDNYKDYFRTKKKRFPAILKVHKKWFK
tara:strand:+ start:1257 stop:1748 length:492 start_codon:yes stop_codon:yes gene_type:complete